MIFSQYWVIIFLSPPCEEKIEDDDVDEEYDIVEEIQNYEL
jgi:hypothetical protein